MLRKRGWGRGSFWLRTKGAAGSHVQETLIGHRPESWQGRQESNPKPIAHTHTHTPVPPQRNLGSETCSGSFSLSFEVDCEGWGTGLRALIGALELMKLA